MGFLIKKVPLHINDEKRRTRKIRRDPPLLNGSACDRPGSNFPLVVLLAEIETFFHRDPVFTHHSTSCAAEKTLADYW